MYIDILINSITSTRALCDSGCQCFATVSEQFVKERGLDASSIQPRPLEQVTTTKNRPMIQQIAIFIADIDGMEEKIVVYVIPGQIDNIILGKGWMERHNISIRPPKGQVCIRKPFKIIVNREQSHHNQLKKYMPRQLKLFKLAMKSCRFSVLVRRTFKRR